jgi:diamine N-acetyltransferase
MIVLNKYNILVEQLNIETLETLRLWRNSVSVTEFMEYKKEISKEEQQLWFANINPEKEFYFIIKKDKFSIGMIHVNKINSETKSAEVGLFIGKNNFQGTGITFGASLNLLDFAFDELNLNEVFAKVNIANKNAIMYNSFLGFTEEYALNINFTMWKLTCETYKKNKAKIEKCLL